MHFFLGALRINPSPAETGADFENSLDPDQLASEEPVDLGPRCFLFRLLNQYSKKWNIAGNRMMWMHIGLLIFHLHLRQDNG